MATKRISNSKLARAALSILMASALFPHARPAFGCGPFVARAVFVYEKHPDLPLAPFAAGNLGVLEPSYARSYLVVAYRYLTGIGLDKEEQASALAVWDARLKRYWEGANEQDPMKMWGEAVGKVSASTTKPNYEVYRSETSKDTYITYLNCPPDAFKNAAETLNRLIAKHGASSAEAKDFAETQGRVFAVCAEGKNIPEAASPAASPVIKANRAYQIAAANFYAGNFDAAQKMFSAIAADSSSPWRQTAPYLVARTLIRKATLTAPEGKSDTAALAEAQAQLRKILADKNQSAMHQSAKGLLSFVRFRLAPAERLGELAADVLKKNTGANFKQDLIDYTLLLDRFVGDTEDTNKEKKFADIAQVGRSADLTDWVLTFQVNDADALNHCLERWEKTSSLPWLVASLTKISANHPKLPALLQTAAKTPPASQAFASVVFHTLRLLSDMGRKDGVRSQLDQLLPKAGPLLPPSALNHFLSLRMKVAANLDEFLKYSQRVPSGVTYDEDGRELPVDKDEATDEVKKSPRIRASWDADAEKALNVMLPSSVLKDAAASNSLPAHLRRDLAIATWARAALLEDEATALALVPLTSSLAPELKQDLNAYAAAQDKAEKRFAAVYLMLKYPGVRPSVDASMGRVTELGKIDDYRDNWWCEYGQVFSADPATAATKPQLSGTASSPDFLTAAQKSAATAEWKRLVALGAAPNYFCAEAIKWANLKPADPRAPEALHLAVRATRYGCSDKQTGAFSKQAYDTLHRKYPKSTWAQKTKYWFKG